MRIVAAALLLIASAGGAGAFTQTKFATEADAQGHCPRDVVVWVIVPSNAIVRRGDPHYGATRGAYICERDALAAGDHLARR